MAFLRHYKFPKWLKRFYPNAIWGFFVQTNANQPKIYLTFDDGPTPEVTQWVIEQLDKYQAKATFFCIGKNVKNHPKIYQQILGNGHVVGNHSMTHLNGIKSEHNSYMQDVLAAKQVINSKLFRPPYGKSTVLQYKELTLQGFKFVFWSHLTYDFDDSLSSKKRIKKTLKQSKNGSILVFHDSEKAFPQLKHDLPIILAELHQQGFTFESIKV